MGPRDGTPRVDDLDLSTINPVRTARRFRPSSPLFHRRRQQALPGRAEGRCGESAAV